MKFLSSYNFTLNDGRSVPMVMAVFGETTLQRDNAPAWACGAFGINDSNIAKDHPEIVERTAAEYAAFLRDIPNSPFPVSLYQREVLIPHLASQAKKGEEIRPLDIERTARTSLAYDLIEPADEFGASRSHKPLVFVHHLRLAVGG